MTAVLLHGCHLQAKEWENIMWGTPPSKGRIPKAVEMVLKFNAKLFVVGSGASKDEETGDVECDVIWNGTGDKEKLSNYFSDLDMTKLWEIGGGPDSKAQNTREELLNMRDRIEYYEDGYIDTLILVSSPTHLPRCLRDACSIFADTDIQILAAPSDTCFADITPEDVFIFEPPHLPTSLPFSYWDLSIKRMVRLLFVDKRDDFALRLQDFVMSF